MARNLTSDSDSAATFDGNVQRVAPGKRSPTDRLQRKASAPPASDAAPMPWTDSSLSSAPFVDSLLTPVQRHGDGGGDGDVHALAASGTAGAGHALPFLDQIQASFGDHDVRGVQAHTDGAASAAATGMGANAFAAGNHVAFASAPDLHTAAHEAAHVVQQQAGVSLKGGVGEVGDPYERHADAVADAVVRGESAQALLDHGPHGSGGTAIQHKVTQSDGPDKSDPEAELNKLLASLSARMTAAKATMGKGGQAELDEIRSNAITMSAELSLANYQLSRLGKGGQMAKYAALVRRTEPAIEALYAWARTVRVYQAKFSLDAVFDRWDDLLFAVGLDKQMRAEKYYADWTVHPDEMSPERAKDAKDHPVTQHDLVDECVRMFDQATVVTPMLAISQFETMLSEPVAPPEPALVEKLIRLAGSMLVTYFGGKVAEELGHVLTKALNKAEGFKEKVVEKIEGKVETLADKIKGEDEPGKPDGGGGSKVKTEFLDKTRFAAFVAMQNGGAALTAYKHDLLRREPYEIGQLHAQLSALPKKLWAEAKQKVIFEWLNLKASFDRDFKKDKPNQLDFHGGGRVGEKGGQVLERLGRERGIYKQWIEFGDRNGVALDAKAPQLEGMEDAVKRELVGAAVPMLKLPLHRRLSISRRDHYYGTSRTIASVYLTADHQLVIEQMDNYSLAKIQRGETIDGPKNPNKPSGTGGSVLDQLPDPMPKSEKEMADEFAQNPSHYDTGTATKGLWKLLNMIKTTTADLGGSGGGD